ncbi:hypothetical protein RGQ29_018952 [Quercus rubra]|uniref:DUF4220 domain-containing protein n=1 Tax=Quercus rubra TaxID=3512 RepID=A0AAN7F8N3_QUERU|nr:hypothetical protein RGQ29_018952 [Quercus rubra]
MVVGNVSVVLNNATNVPSISVHQVRRTLLFIEVYVILTTLLIAFLVVFGSYRRRSHSTLIKYLIWTAYVLSTYLISYTMGQMKSVTFHDELFAVWAMFLLIFLGSADCISAHSLEDNENRKRYNLEIFIQYFWLGWLIGKHGLETRFKVPLCFLYALSLLRTVGRAKALELASKSIGLVRNAKLIADYMDKESEDSVEEANSTCMKGYKYLVKGEKKKMIEGRYQIQLDNDEAITIERIWQCQGKLLSSNGDPDERHRDICLSYALYRLLCCRFAKFSFSESSQAKMSKFVQDKLLEGDDHERPFRVIEVELAFLFDFFYTKYPALFDKGITLLRTLEFILVIIGCSFLALILSNYQAPMVDLNLMTRSGRVVDVLTTGIVIVAVMLMEVVQIFVINFSNWAKVQWLCCYFKNPSWHNSKWIEKIIQFICHTECLKPWDRKLGQYSLLESFNHNPCGLLYNSLTSPYIDMERKGQKESSRITLPDEVKKDIIGLLKTTMAARLGLANGKASLQKPEVGDLSWACELETQTHIIMVWHIATCLCELDSPPQDTPENKKTREKFNVATKLSKYCAYLVAFAPRLLPDHPYNTELIFDQVVDEARDKLKECTSKEKIRNKMSELRINNHTEAGTIIEKGFFLAKKLTEKQIEKWAFLANLWAEMMLFVALSDDELAHAEHLAMGGEFVTHLWALLSHAGMHKRNSAQGV